MYIYTSKIQSQDGAPNGAPRFLFLLYGGALVDDQPPPLIETLGYPDGLMVPPSGDLRSRGAGSR